MAGFPTAEEFYVYLGYMLLYLYAVRALAIAASCVFDSRHAAAMTTGFILTVATLGSGFTLHSMVRFMSLFSPPKQAMRDCTTPLYTIHTTTPTFMSVCSLT